jgi:trimeric autotransporter adhesin
MTSNNQVSPVIRISRGERDASARATHLKAASRKYLETTIERKQMSTTTNFKRIALVAVAALGLGVLSSVPSQAATMADSLTVSQTTAAQTTAETVTSSVTTVTFAFTATDTNTDAMKLTASLTSGPAGGGLPYLAVVETTNASVRANSGAGTALVAGATINPGQSVWESSTSVAANSVISAKFNLYIGTSSTGAPALPGTYVVSLTPVVGLGGGTLASTAKTVTITVTTAATADKNMSPTKTTAYIQPTTTNSAIATGDSTIVALKTPNSTDPVANIYVTQLNAAGTAATESVTATITGAGILGANASLGSAVATGRSLNVLKNDYIEIFADGNTGVGTITLTGATSGVLIATKTVTFSDTVATKYATPTIAATDSSVIAVAGTTKVSVLAQDASSNLVSGLVGGTDYYAHSSNTAIATVATYSYSATTGYGVIVTGVAAGEAEITFGNASTLAASTIKSAAIKVRVGSGSPSNVTLTTDKASYAPGEKITLTVTILDSTGKNVVGATSYANIFSSAGVTASMNLASGTLPTSTISDYSNTTNTKTFTLYAPVTGGTVTFTGTGGTALATANQVAKTVSVTVTDSGSAALAAVTALATTVASLRTLIVTLTNLVLKIQKKVKA